MLSYFIKSYIFVAFAVRLKSPEIVTPEYLALVETLVEPLYQPSKIYPDFTLLNVRTRQEFYLQTEGTHNPEETWDWDDYRLPSNIFLRLQ